MTYRDPARAAARRTRSKVLAALAVTGAALLGVTATQFDLFRGDPEPASVGIDSDPPPTEEHGWRDDHDRRDRDSDPSTAQEHGEHGRHDRRDLPTLLGQADGVVPDEVTVFDDGFPAVANLDPALLDALRRAAADAEDEGEVFFVNSGWRSPAYQEQLLREAVSEYGSEQEAARWVATPDTSLHVSGDAVDIGPSGAASWLSGHGAEYGLCQIYGNEPWHYELRPDAVDDGCPPMYADPTHDPRMRQ